MDYKTYLEIRNQTPYQIVAVRLGDFYEVMGNDAVFVAEKLDLTLTSRKQQDGSRVNICGFPYHIAREYQDKLLEQSGVLMHLLEIDEKENIKCC